MADKPADLTVVVPTYNEAENLPKLVSALLFLDLPLKICVVDDNSPDGTGQIAEELAGQHKGLIEVLHRPQKLGLGSAYISAFQHCLANGAQAVAQMDADFSHPPEKLVELFHLIEDCDVAIGSRYVRGGTLDERWPLWRRSLSGFGNYYARTILGLRVRDVTAGFKVWRSETLRAMPLERVRSNGYSFQIEMVYLASLLGFKIKETPIHFADRRWGQSKMSLKIQREAAARVWGLLCDYRDLRRK